jgi:hypothetical protein
VLYCEGAATSGVSVSLVFEMGVLGFKMEVDRVKQKHLAAVAFPRIFQQELGVVVYALLNSSLNGLSKIPSRRLDFALAKRLALFFKLR